MLDQGCIQKGGGALEFPPSELYIWDGDVAISIETDKAGMI